MSERRRADMFVELDTDPREGGPTTGDERATLLEFLRTQRLTLEMKCSGLTAAQLAQRAVEPSTLSLLGLIRHMADVERAWFRGVMAQQDAPSHYGTDEAPDADFDEAVGEDAVVADAWKTWREEIAFSEGFVTEAPDLAITAPEQWRGEVSLRWVVVHMIEEYARHNGHADLLRERIDGRVGQ